MKIKNKGKVHPSPSSATDPILSPLQLLPAAILSLAAALPPPDLQVLSYLLARSLHPSSSSSSSHHNSSSFGCDCFDCYTVYWLRWDSSPNRDIIHRVIDAFEDHLSSSSSSSPSPAAGKSKVGRRRRNAVREKRQLPEVRSLGGGDSEAGIDPEAAPVRENNVNEDSDEAIAAKEDTSTGSSPPPYHPREVVGMGSRGGGEHKGLARKVLPDVLGILNSRLWNLWSPDL